MEVLSFRMIRATNTKQCKIPSILFTKQSRKKTLLFAPFYLIFIFSSLLILRMMRRQATMDMKLTKWGFFEMRGIRIWIMILLLSGAFVLPVYAHDESQKEDRRASAGNNPG